jgi:hypothetical protein
MTSFFLFFLTGFFPVDFFTGFDLSPSSVGRTE